MGKDRIIVALDVDSVERATDLVDQLKDEVGAFKIGLELVNNVGFGIFDAVKEHGAENVFYDGKFLDIPNTVAGASRAATKLGVWMFNVHCSGGLKMMQAAKDASVLEADALDHNQYPKVIGVTVLTSLDFEALEEVGLARKTATDLEIGPKTAKEYIEMVVEAMAKTAQKAGLDGVVASPKEIEIVRKACGKDFLIVTPGIRSTDAPPDDQARTATPKEAIERGADYLVIGRPITKALDPVAAARAIAAEIAEAIAARH